MSAVADTLAHPQLLAVTVHGPAGVLDLVVPAGAAAGDVAQEYAEQVGLVAAPDLRTRIGAPIPADVPLLRAGVGTGDVLVATAGGPPPAARRTDRRDGRCVADGPDPVPGLAGLWFAVAAAARRRRRVVRRDRLRRPAGRRRRRAGRRPPRSGCCRSVGWRRTAW